VLGGSQFLFAINASDDAGVAQIFFDNSNALRYGISSGEPLVTAAVYRDVSAWYHVVFVYDTANATAGDRYILYVNGVRQTTSTYTAPSPSFAGGINRTSAHAIGRREGNNDLYFNGYLADIHFIDGQALTPSSFTEVSATTGQLIPKTYSGTFGTNGFWLKFSDNSTTAALGTDTSGNNNTWTVNNLYPGGANYSSRGSLSASPPILYGTIADIFDGSLAASGGSFSVNQANAGVTVSFSPALPSGSLVKLIGNVYGTAGSNSSLQVNGTSYAQSLPSSPGTGTDTELSVPAGTSGITSIYMYREGVSTFNYTLFGITVDGILLVDAAAGASLVDTPTSYGTPDTGVGGEVRGNYCTLNPLHSQGATFSNGNLQFATASIGKIFGTIAVSSGKWYWEAQNLSSNSLSSLVNGVGLISGNPNTYGGGDVGDYAWLTRSNTGSPSSAYNNGNILSGYGNVGVPQNAIVGTAFNADIGTLEFFVNGVSQGVAWNNIPVGGDKLYAPISGDPNSSTDTQLWPTRLCLYSTKWLQGTMRYQPRRPIVAKPNTLMDVALYTGNGSTQSITGLAFSPDFVWIKCRSSAEGHALMDVVRGSSKRLFSELTDAEDSTATLTSFDSNGFSVSTAGGSSGRTNASSQTYAAWTWDAGTSTVSNTAGSITSQVRANASAGFAVVTGSTPSTAILHLGMG
jgi:hypothetical protein